MLPHSNDWKSEPWGIDTPHAYAHFFTKSAEEAVQLFSDNEHLYWEDLLYVPKACFPFYFGAYLTYLEARPDAISDVNTCSGLGSLVKARRLDILDLPAPGLLRTKTILKKTDAAEKLYGASSTQAGDSLQLLDEKA